ncbi:MAG: DUF5977 domain-containing protein [Sediminibacterium sp.]|jgi:hypothetical protein|nr:DUF5977 domain-containing protein [Sediminibacterium sp.]
MDEILAGLKHLPLKLTRNKLTIHIDAATPTNPIRSGMLTYAEIYVPEAYQSPNYILVSKRMGSEKPVSILSGLPFYYGTDFDIEKILDGKVSYCPPNLKINEIQLCPTLTVPYKVRSYIEKDRQIIVGTEQNSTTEFALKGGLKADDFAGWKDEFFTTYFNEKLPFLTNSSSEKEISRDQPEYLYFLVNIFPKPTTLKLRITLYFNDGTDDIFTIKTVQNVEQYSVYSIPAGFSNLGLEIHENIVKKIVSYELWVSNQDDKRISEVRTFTLDERYYRNDRYIVFSNSLGGYDTMRVTGVGRETLKVTKQSGERELESNYLPSSSDIFVTGIEGRPETTINTGFLDADATAYLAEILFSEDIYILTKDGLVPVILVDDSLMTIEDNVDLTSRNLTFTHAKKETAFSALPVAPTVATRELRWEPSGPYCVYSPDTGLSTGFQGATTLTLVYADNGEPVKGVPPKNNTPGTEGYVPPQISSACGNNYAPFKNVSIARLGTYRKNDCVGGFGDFANIVVSANLYGGLTQAEADNRAEAHWNFLNTQEFANQNALCIASPEFYTLNPIPPVSRFNFRYAFGAGVSGVVYIHGGPGANGDNNAVVFGNHWAIQNNVNPNSILYSPGRNDCIIANDLAGHRYYITFFGYNQNRRMRLFVNGILKEDISVTASQMLADGGVHIYQLPATTVIPSQATVYCLVENF